MIFRKLDRYVLKEWTRIFLFTSLGFPLIAILFELVDRLQTYLSRDIPPADIALAYLYGMPEQIFRVIPAAVLFSTVFSIGSLSRNSELTAMKAAGVSFNRFVLPIFLFGALAGGLNLTLGELAPYGSLKKSELLGEVQQRSRSTRFNFVYRADQGWVYVIRTLDITQNLVRETIFTREGVGEDYPTLVAQANRGHWDSTSGTWTLYQGRFRVVADDARETVFAFDSMIPSSFKETPTNLLADPKRPEEMSYRELGEYIGALDRSGSDTRLLKVQRELKLAIPFTALIIAIFGAPMAVSQPRAGSAFGVAVSLGTTVIFLILVQLSQAIGSGGLLPPVVAAWAPNIVFGVIGLVLLKFTPT